MNPLERPSRFAALPVSAQGFSELATILRVGELAILWLLIWGAKDQPSSKVGPAPATAPIIEEMNL